MLKDEYEVIFSQAVFILYSYVHDIILLFIGIIKRICI